MGVFGQSLFAMPPRVRGVQLKRFSAYHAQCLLELDSPFITGAREPTAGETATALVVCASRRSDGLETVQRLLGSRWQGFKWSVKWMFGGYVDAANALADHIAESAKCPQTWQHTDGGSGGNTGADWPFYIVSVIARTMQGIAYTDLWDMPLAELMCHKTIIAEDNGQVEIAERDLEFARKRKEAE